MKTKKPSMLSVLLSLTFLYSFAPQVLAEDEEGGPVVTYVEMKEPFVVNYGAPVVKNLKFVKTTISVRAESQQKADLVEKHEPYFRNEIVMILSSFPDEVEKLKKAKTTARETMVEMMNDFIKKEEGVKHAVEDVLFTEFMTQR